MRVIHGLNPWKVRAGFLLGILGLLVVYGFSEASQRHLPPREMIAFTAFSQDGTKLITSSGDRD
ncbi:MAG: hypothetical protein ACK53G_12555, partial [Armatimonadota bacterium]